MDGCVGMESPSVRTVALELARVVGDAPSPLALRVREAAERFSMPLDMINTAVALAFILVWALIGEIVVRGRA